MTTHIASALEALLGEDDGPEAVKRHRLTILKQNTQSVRPTVIKARVANHADLAKLFHQVEPIVAVLGWDVNSMRAYALAVMKSDVHDVRRRKTSDRQMHLIAFVAYQVLQPARQFGRHTTELRQGSRKLRGPRVQGLVLR